MPKRQLSWAILAALVAIAIGIVLSYVIKWFPVQASTQAHNTDTLYHVLVIASIPIFVLVVTVILYSVWQFRMKPGEELKDGPPIHGNTRLEVIWTTIPALLLLGLVSYSFVVLHENEKKPAREIQVEVTGQQFFWSFRYPKSVTGGAPINSYQLDLPEGESVEFDLHSRDVIHAFWIPAFRIQED
ncbi:MAG TPA: cytochrome c oxidase subunit II, partial [Solirubrobacteraceae bacterium]